MICSRETLCSRYFHFLPCKLPRLVPASYLRNVPCPKTILSHTSVHPSSLLNFQRASKLNRIPIPIQERASSSPPISESINSIRFIKVLSRDASENCQIGLWRKSKSLWRNY